MDRKEIEMIYLAAFLVHTPLMISKIGKKEKMEVSKDGRIQKKNLKLKREKD